MTIKIYIDDEEVDLSKERFRRPSGSSWRNYCERDFPDDVDYCCTLLQDLCSHKCKNKILDDTSFEYSGCVADCDSAWSDCSAVLEDDIDPTAKKQKRKKRKAKKP